VEHDWRQFDTYDDERGRTLRSFRCLRCREWMALLPTEAIPSGECEGVPVE